MTSPTASVPSRAQMRLKRHPRWLIAGVMVVTLGGLGTSFSINSLVASEDVLAVTRTIHRGQTVAASDLTVVSVNRSLGLSTVPAAQASSLIGQVAATDLPGGSLLVSESVGAPEIPSGMARVGLRLASGRLPASGLNPGSPVLVVALAEPQASETDAELLESVPATIASEPATQPDGTVVVDVLAPNESAEAVARLSATDRLALVRQGDAP